MDELAKTYTVTHSRDGWRVNFATGIAPGFGLEPHYSLLELVERVESLYPEYRPRLNESQLADYTFQLKDRVDEVPGFAPEAVNALLRCLSPELRASEKLVIEEVAKRTFENDHGLMALIEELKKGKGANEIQTSGAESRLLVDHQAREIENVIRQTADLREGLIGLAKNLQKPGAGLDRNEIAENLTVLHHQLSDLRAHVDIARREVALARIIGSAGSGMGRNGCGSKTVHGFMRGIPEVRTAEPRGKER